MEKRVINTGEKLIEEMAAVLVKIFRLFQSLLSLVKEERQFLVESDAEAVDNISGKKQEILFSWKVWNKSAC